MRAKSYILVFAIVLVIISLQSQNIPRTSKRTGETSQSASPDFQLEASRLADLSENPLYSRLIESWKQASRPKATPKTSDGLTLLGEWRWGPCFSTGLIDSNHVAIGNGELMQVLDVSNPIEPQIIAEVPTTGVVFDIAISGNYAYAIGNGGLDIIDLSDLSNLEIVATWSDSIFYVLVATDIRGIPYIYLGGDNFSVLDVSEPLQPQRVATLPVFQLIWQDMQLYIDEQEQVYLYAPNSEGFWTEAFDVTDPTAPIQHGVSIPGSFGLAVSDDYLFVGGARSIRVFSLADPLSPEEITRLQVPAKPTELVAAGTYLYAGLTPDLSDTLWAVQTVDISDIVNPISLGTVVWPGPATQAVSFDKIILANEKAYVASTVALWGVDVAELSKPETLFYFPTASHRSRRIVCQDEYAYVASEIAGLWVLDVSNPAKPEAVGHFRVNGSASDVAVQDTMVYLLHSVFRFPMINFSISLLSVSDPTRPTLISTLSNLDLRTDRSPSGIDVTGEYLYVPGKSELLIIDVNPPEQAQVVGTFPLDYVSDVSIQDSLAFVARGFFPNTDGNGVHILNLTNPIDPEEISVFPPWGARVVETVSSNIYVATVSFDASQPGFNGFAIVDVSDPGKPIELSRRDTLSTYTSGIGLAVSESWAYLTLEQGGTKVINIENPRAPEIIATVKGEFDVELCDVGAQKDLILLDRSPGVSIYRNDFITGVPENDPTIPDDFKLFQNYPNPFNPETAIRYGIPAVSEVKLSVYNMLGQKIYTLVESKQVAGTYTISWDGKDGRGKPVASGLYLYRLQAGQFVQTRKMLLLR